MGRTLPNPDRSRRPTDEPFGNDGACLFNQSVFSEPGLADFWRQAGLAGGGQAPVPSDWVVVVESTMYANGGGLAELDALLAHLSEWEPSALYHEGVYALQLHITAATGPEALCQAGTYHDQAAQAAGLGGTAFVRAEVLTLAEYEHDCTAEPTEERGAQPGTETSFVPVALYGATRALLAASTQGQITEILTDFVLAVGGSVHVGPRTARMAMEAETVIDLSLGPDRELFAVADTLSVAGLLLEQTLPALVEDARRAALALTRCPRSP